MATTLKKTVGKGRHLSAMKRHRQSVKRNARNKSARSEMGTFVKRVYTAIEEGNKEKIEKTLKDVGSKIAKTASKGVIPKKRASRVTSRLNKAAVKALSA